MSLGILGSTEQMEWKVEESKSHPPNRVTFRREYNEIVCEMMKGLNPMDVRGIVSHGIMSKLTRLMDENPIALRDRRNIHNLYVQKHSLNKYKK